MITVLRLLWILLTILWAGGWWALARRRRLISEKDVARAEQWHAATRDLPPNEDPLLVCADLALTEGHEPPTRGTRVRDNAGVQVRTTTAGQEGVESGP